MDEDRHQYFEGRNDLVIHNHGGRLYTINTTGQLAYDFAEYLNGLKPLAHKPNLTLCGSYANLGIVLLKCF